jgi:ABC-type glycerol-3-phosphate transport system permease component
MGTTRGMSLLRAVAIMVFGVVILFPIYWMLVVAVSPLGFSRQVGGFAPDTFTFANFTALFTDRPMGTWIGNSLIVALTTSALSLLLSTSAGYVLSRLKFRGSHFLLLAVLMTQMMPATAIIVPMYTLLRDLGLLNTLQGVVVSHMTLVIPLAIWMIRGFFDSIPVELEKAARIDGCSRLSAFWFVALPLAAPGLAAVFIYGFVTSWHEFLFARTFVSPEELWTAAVGLAAFKGEYFSLFEPQMAAAVVFALPVAIVFIVLQRHFVSGGMAGGVK